MTKSISIHPTAVIDPTAELGTGVQIGPYAVIGPHCHIGDGTQLGPHAVIMEYTTLGKRCQVFSGAVIGAIPQDLKYRGEITHVVIGNDNVIREYVTINRATGEGEVTKIGDRNLFMAYVHIAHDCLIGDGCVLANSVNLAGHVTIEDHAFIGGITGVHQFVRIGSYSMIGGMSRISQDVLPFMLTVGVPPRVYGVNMLGLKRRRFSPGARNALKQAYKLIFRSGLSLTQAEEEIKARVAPCHEIDKLLSFIHLSERGICGLSEDYTDALAGAEE